MWRKREEEEELPNELGEKKKKEGKPVKCLA